MGINAVNDQSSAWGAAFRNKPIFFMSVKETEAFFAGKLKNNMVLQEDSCTLSSNNTYRRAHTTYEVSDKDKGSAFLDLDFLIKDETSSLRGKLSDDKVVITTSPCMMNTAIRWGRQSGTEKAGRS